MTAAESTGASDHTPHPAATATPPDSPSTDMEPADTDTVDPVAGLRVAGGASGVDEPTTAVSVASASSTATDSATSVPTLLLPAAQAMPVPTHPVSVVSGLVSGLLAWVGLGPGLTNAPAAPVQPPLLWGLLEWVRRQVQHTFFNRTPTTTYNPFENSYSADGVITGDLRAVDPDGDPLTFTVTRAPEHGSVVVNPGGTFTYTPNSEFARVRTDTFTITVDDSAAYRLPGFAGQVQDLLHRGAQRLGFSGADGIDSHPIVVAMPSVVATIAVGDGPGGIALSPDGSRAYVTRFDDDLVSVIDTTTNAVIATIPVGDYPVQVVVTPDGGYAYVSNPVGDTVSVIDTATNTVVATVPGGGQAPNGVAVSPDGAYVYFSSAVASLNAGKSVSVVETATNTVVDVITVGDSPTSVAVSPDGATIYVANSADGTVSVIDAASNSVTDTITVGGGPVGLAVSPDGARVYVTHFDSFTGDTVSVINTATNAVIATIAVGQGPAGVAFTPGGGTALVANSADDTVSVIRRLTNSVIATIDVGDGPGQVVVSPDGTRAYVVNSFDGTVSVIAL